MKKRQNESQLMLILAFKGNQCRQHLLQYVLLTFFSENFVHWNPGARSEILDLSELEHREEQ